MKKIAGYIAAGVVLIIALTVGSIYYKQYQKQHHMQQQLAEKVLRFHVVANSDNLKDQQLKLAVRDAVGGYMKEKMNGVASKEECQSIVVEELAYIEQVANNVIAKEGYNYPVEAKLTTCDFPEKTYGEYTFPEGCYDALRVTIGEGNGQNWWCVMYPNMCFANSMYEVVDETSEKALRAVLNEEEYETVLKSGDYEVRLWILEIFK